MSKRLLFVSALIMITFSNCNCQSQPITEITVAIYPWLPRPEQFKSVLAEKWKSVHSDIKLRFLDFDCYHQDPFDSLDVFVYDGIFLKYFSSKGYLLPLSKSQIDDWEGFLPFAQDAASLDGKYYGAPYTGCANILVYRKSDIGLDTMKRDGIDALLSVLGNAATPNDTIPPVGKGMMMDLNSSSQIMSLYAMTEMTLTKQYSTSPLLPDGDLDKNVISHLNTLCQITGRAQSQYADPGGQRSKWFGQGYGRCFVGYTEDLCYLPGAATTDVKFRLLPVADSYLPTTEEFYVDLASVNTKVRKDKIPLALELLNMMTSAEVMYKSMIADNANDNPQFIMPVRGKVLADLVNVHPLYSNMAAIVLRWQPKPLLLDKDCKSWLSKNKAKLKASILSGTGK